MPYVYEGDGPTRVDGVRYAPGATTEDEAVANKPGFKKISDNEAAEAAQNRPGTYASAKPNKVMGSIADAMAWIGRATTSAPLNVVVGDNEAPYGPPSGTITTKQAVMRDASSSVERRAFGDHEWLPEDVEERKLDEHGESGQVQAAQGRESGLIEEVTQQLLDAQQEQAEEESKSAKSDQKSRTRPASSE